MPSPVTPKQLPGSVEEALGVHSGRSRNTADMFTDMGAKLKLAGTICVAFEEASHIVEDGSKMPPRAAGDWFKRMMDRLGITIFLFGVPRLERLFASNEQLRRRSQARREFRPYDFADPAGWVQFASCVRTYQSMFATAGWPISVDFDDLVKHCYLASGGLIGVLSALMRRLAYDAEPRGPGAILFEHCRDSAAKVELAGHPLCQPFLRAKVTEVELNQAHAFVLEEAGMAVRRAA